MSLTSVSCLGFEREYSNLLGFGIKKEKPNVDNILPDDFNIDLSSININRKKVDFVVSILKSKKENLNEKTSWKKCLLPSLLTLGIYYIVIRLSVFSLNKEINKAKKTQEKKVEEFFKNHSIEDLDRLTTKDANYLLGFAVQFDNKEIIKKLIEKGADINQKDEEGKPLIAKFLDKGRGDKLWPTLEKLGPYFVIFLLKKGFKGSPELMGAFLGFAISKPTQNLELVQILIEQSLENPHINLNTLFDFNRSALSWAAYDSHDNIVDALIQAGVDLDKVDDNGDTALTLALKRGRTEIAKKLIEAGADINQTDEQGNSLVLETLEKLEKLKPTGRRYSLQYKYVAQKLDPDFMPFLLKKGFNGSPEQMKAFLGFAILMENLELVQTLIELERASPNIDLNAPFRLNGSALGWAAYKGSSDIVDALIEAGVDLDKVDDNGDTALTLALERGHEEIALKLIDRGANCWATNKQGQNARSLAAAKNLEKVVEALEPRVKGRSPKKV